MASTTYGDQLARRADEMIDAAVAAGPRSLWSAHALMARGDSAGAGALVESQLGRPGDGPFATVASGTFEVLAAMFLVCRWGDELPVAAVDRARMVMTRGILHRGNTENHWLMHYVANLLAAERWAEESTWWNGLSPAVAHAEARRWILGMIARTARYGHHEYDSPQYHLCHVLSMLALTEHASDRLLRDQAERALTLLVADMAVEHFYGGWAGGHSREGYRKNTWQRTGDIHGLHFLYFGGEPFDPAQHLTGMIGPALTAAWRPPEVLHDIAHDRDTPHAVLKTKAPRTIFRHAERESAPVRKYTWMSPSFALGSTQTGLPGAPAGPIDLVSWDLTWRGAGQSAKIVCNHPYRDPRRFSAFLSELPQAIGRSVPAAKPYLQFPDRLFGASPYEQIIQHEGMLLALYRIPADDPCGYVNLFLPDSTVWQQAGGWILGDLGAFFVALFPIGGYQWVKISEDRLVDGWLIRIEERLAGLVLEAVESSAVGDFKEYCEARVGATPDLAAWRQSGRVRATTHHGHDLTMTFDGDHLLDGQKVDYATYPLYDGPWVRGDLGSGRVTIARGGHQLTLDFDLDVHAPDLPMRVVG
jgi:hypothetical protein